MTTQLLTRGAEGLWRRAFSFQDVEAMVRAGVLDSEERFELIEGEIVPVNSQNMPHMLWKARLTKWFNLTLPPRFILVPEGTLRLRDARPASVFETDLLIFELEEGAQAIRPSMVRLAVEVADSSIGRDRDIKAPLYARYGVSELWILDVNARTTRVCRGPGPDGYAEVRDVAFAEPVAAAFLPGAAVTVADLDQRP